MSSPEDKAEREREARQVADAAEVAARATFGPFIEEAESPFSEAEHLTPKATWDEIAAQVTRVAAAAALAGYQRHSITAGTLVGWHRQIFGGVFPDRAGELHRGRDRGQYAIVLGTPGRPVSKVRVGAQGRDIGKRLSGLCDRFNADAAQEDEREEGSVRGATPIAARFYARLLAIHPFLDGNGRLAFVALQYALVRLGLICVALPDWEQHQWALGQALRQDGRQTFDVLAGLLADKILEADPNWAG